MKFKFFVALILLSFLPAFSQSWEAVTNNPEYLYGEGRGVTVAEADRMALNDLISKISVNVEGQVTTTERENMNDDSLNSSFDFKAIVKTYSQATLNNTEKVILENEPDAHVGRWIKRSEVDKIFESRKFKIKDYVSSALKAEKDGKIDVALKDYYWALALLKSLQNPNEPVFTTEEGEEVVMMNWIPHQMNDIFSQLKTSVSHRNGDEVEILITYKDRPVNSIDYTYFDGRDWSAIYSAKDGVGVLDLAPGNSGDDFQIKFEYEYRGESHIDKDVELVLAAIPAVSMRNAWQSFKGGQTHNINRANTSSTSSASFTKVPRQIFSKPVPVSPSPEISRAMKRVENSILAKDYDSVKDLFTPSGLDIYEKLLKYGKAKIVGQPDIKFYESNGSVVARGLQMAFSFASGMRKSFVEDLVFTFNQEGKIDNIAFGLGKTAEDDILGKGVWDENARFAIMNFLENYQTAYALGRLDYIETVFDDDAVIITGKVVKKGGSVLSGDSKGVQFGGTIIEYNRHNKKSYLNALKKSFDSKEFINLRFADNDVLKLGMGGEMYAIQISQEYYSSNYGDKGYLFLMIDINDPNNPIIKVRTWQPEKDPDFGLYGPGDFNM